MGDQLGLQSYENYNSTVFLHLKQVTKLDLYALVLMVFPNFVSVVLLSRIFLFKFMTLYNVFECVHHQSSF